MHLYNAMQSTCSQRVRLALHEKDIAFEETILDLFVGDQLKPEYLKLNPNGLVPTLVHDGQPIIDSSVIVEYLDDISDETALRPADPVATATMRAWMRFFDEVAAPAVRVPSYNNVFLRHFQKMSDEEFIALGNSKPLRKAFFLKMGRTGYPPEEVEQASDRLGMTIKRMDKALADGPWLLGQQFSLADITIVPVIARLDDIGLASLWQESEHVGDWFERLKARPAYERAFYHGAMLSEQYPDVGH